MNKLFRVGSGAVITDIKDNRGTINDCERLHYVSYPRNGKSNDEVTV